MRERLIELINQKQEAGWRFTDDEYTTDVFNSELADHLLANGVIVPPCKVGDTVYFEKNNSILKSVAKWIETNAYGWCVCAEYPPMSTRVFRFDDFGKTVFLTREDAERVLKGGEG